MDEATRKLPEVTDDELQKHKVMEDFREAIEKSDKIGWKGANDSQVAHYGKYYKCFLTVCFPHHLEKHSLTNIKKT